MGWLKDFFKGAYSLSTGEKMDPARGPLQPRRTTQGRLQNIENGYVTITIPAYNMAKSQQGLDIGLPVISGVIKVENTTNKSTVKKVLMNTPENAQTVTRENYYAGSVSEIMRTPYSASTISLIIAIKFMENQNLYKETVQLISEVVAQIPSAEASAPFLGIIDKSIDVMDEILRLGQREDQLSVNDDIDLTDDNLSEYIIYYTQQLNVGGRIENIDPEKLRYDETTRTLLYNNEPYNQVSWMVIKLENEKNYPNLHALPIYGQSLQKLLAALQAARANFATVSTEQTLLNALLLIESDIAAVTTITRDDQERMIEDLREWINRKLELYSSRERSKSEISTDIPDIHVLGPAQTPLDI